MTSKLEKDLWRLVKDRLPGEAERIENLVGAGVPDVSGVCGYDYWVELKVCRTKLPRVPTVICEPLQVQWHKRRQRQGSVVFVLTRTGDRLQLWLRGDDNYTLKYQDDKPYNWGLFTEAFTTALRR